LERAPKVNETAKVSLVQYDVCAPLIVEQPQYGSGLSAQKPEPYPQADIFV
jgi:hypothetical protein